MATKDPGEVTPTAAIRVVKREQNRVYNPVVSTAEVAEDLGTDEEEAYDLLSESPRANEKTIGSTSVWWL
jgi:hypothetical protein